MNVIIDKIRLQELIDAGGELCNCIETRLSRTDYTEHIVSMWEFASDPKNLITSIVRGEPNPISPDEE